MRTFQYLSEHGGLVGGGGRRGVGWGGQTEGALSVQLDDRLSLHIFLWFETNK